MRIAYFDYRVVANNPVGGLHRHLIEAMAPHHQVTVFSVQFENPAPGHVEWVRVPVPLRPQVLLFVAFHLVAPCLYLWKRFLHRQRFDVVHFIESNLLFGQVSSVHFCHRAYLRLHWTGSLTGIRTWVRWLDHVARALLEPVVYSRARHFVVPSAGLAAELVAEYPRTRDKTRVIANPIEVEKFAPPPKFDRGQARREMGFASDDLVLIFIALGHFGRKGLDYVLTAMRDLPSECLRLLVVGGEQDALRPYQRITREYGLSESVRFLGMTRDVRPLLWRADAFILPSHYETFSKVAFEAAAAGLPLIVSKLHGVSEILRPGWNGLLVEPDAGSVGAALKVFCRQFDASQRLTMGQRAQSSVQAYNKAAFVERWVHFYENLARDLECESTATGQPDAKVF
jgi:glycosyltransferase involved in cell wall biosynthesis